VTQSEIGFLNALNLQTLPLPDSLKLPQYRRWLARSDAQLQQQFQARSDIRGLVNTRAGALDALIQNIWAESCGELNDVCLVAVGGYGRGELHPHSDLDLMVLLGDDGSPAIEESVGRFLTFLWDLKLNVGHSVRSLSDCLAQARSDVTVITNLMEARRLFGSVSLFDRLCKSLTPDRMWPGREYFAAKLEEQRLRHHRFHDTVYNLEPNLKEGPGGLRDVQTLAWVAKRHYGVDSFTGLVDVGFLEPEEHQSLLDGQHYLWRVRWALHQAAGRNEERLLFDHQRELAHQFDYRDQHHENLAVEQFMQEFFRTVMHLERLNERLLLAFGEDILQAGEKVKIESIDAEFQLRNGYLEVVSDQVFQNRPASLFQLFLILQQRPNLEGVRASTIRLLRRNLDLIDDGFRASAGVQKAFMALLRGAGNVPALLSRMHRYEVLGRYLPEFGQVLGRMQFDLFHVYTVDQHTLSVLEYMYQIAGAGPDQAYPMYSDIHAQLEKPELLYLAGIFHDIAKGRGGDHSQLGELDARGFCERHGLSDADTNLVCWLVRQHLVMSVTAQTQDISDPEVVNRFARAVGNLVYLDYLYLLTVADINGTNPKIWNSWKATLLADLYALARKAIQRGLENPARRSEWVAETRRKANGLLLDAGWSQATIDAIWSALPDGYFLRHAAEQVAWQSCEIHLARNAGLPHIGTRQLGGRGTTEILVYSRNRDGTFATILATLGQLELNIVDARVFNTSDGRVVDTFHVFERGGGPVQRDQLLQRIRDRLRQNLSAEILLPVPVEKPLPSRLRHFLRPPEIAFGEIAEHGTQMELICSDHPGLLATVARILFQNRVRVHAARIATFGEKVEDYFHITDFEDAPLEQDAQTRLRDDLVAALAEGDEVQ
jgi:[protein-PII] uridylyltransferase